MRAARYMVTGVVFAALLVPLVSCTFVDSFVPKKGEKSDVADRQQGLTIDDFRDMNKAEKLAKADKSGGADVKITTALGAPPVPDIAQVLAAPTAPKVANSKLVTIAVTEDVPLRDVLFELGRLANVDIELGSGLDKAGINLRATDRPFNEVIERIATLANLRYSVNGKSIRVERDLPYLKSYSLDFLNIVRSSTSDYKLNTVASGGSSGSSSSSSSASSSSSGGSSSSGIASSGSSSTVTAKADSDLWVALEASINEILAYKPNGNDDAAPTDGATSGGAAPAASGGANAKTSSNLVLNRQAGVLSVNATEKQHEMIRRFLAMMSRNSSAQVLIEAKVVEVSLADQFVSGISWNKVLGSINKSYIQVGKFNPSAPTGLSVPGSPFTVGISSGDLDSVITAAQQFGTIRTLSSPRLSAVNNQSAVLTFVRNEVTQLCKYTPAKYDTNATTGVKTLTTDESFECERGTLPIGIILSIMPAINLDSQEVTLSVRPTINRIVDTVTDFTIAFAKSKSTNPDSIPTATIPVVETREIESITRMKSGAVMVIGGLMKDSTSTTQNGAPGISELPLFGNLFKSRSEDAVKSELIIFIKATIVNPDGSAHEADKEIYEKYTTDPRPLFPKQ